MAPDATEEAIAIVGAKKNLRLLLAGGLPDPRAPGLLVKSVAGGLLVQSRDNAVADDMTLKPVTKRAPTERRDARPRLRLPGGEARQVQHHRLCEGSRHRRHRRRPDEPDRFGAHRRAQGAGCGEGTGAQRAADQGLGGGVGCVLPVRRRITGRDRSRRDRGDPARRLDARRRGDQGRRRRRHRHGVHRRRGISGIEACVLLATALPVGERDQHRRVSYRPARSPSKLAATDSFDSVSPVSAISCIEVRMRSTSVARGLTHSPSPRCRRRPSAPRR